MTKTTLQDWKMTMTEHDKEYERILREIRYERQMKRKRLYEQAARTRKAKTVDASKEIPNERV
jgi:hypothetical protein